MIAQQSKNQNLTQTQTQAQTQEINEKQNARRQAMATQMMENQRITWATRIDQPTVFASATEEIRRSWANRLSQIFWRVSFEVEPIFGGLFAPFTAQIRRCRLLSHREKTELETLMKRW